MCKRFDAADRNTDLGGKFSQRRPAADPVLNLPWAHRQWCRKLRIRLLGVRILIRVFFRGDSRKMLR